MRIRFNTKKIVAIKKWFRICLTGFLLLPSVAQAALNVFACEPEWAALVNELGGEHVNSYSATTPAQDPHHVQARPGLIAKARRADLLICTGAGLEEGWLPLLLRKAANKNIQPGTPGYFMATDYVTLLEKPGIVDRRLGDVHADGNPHIHTDPHNLLRAAAALHQRLQTIDAAHSGYYAARFDRFESDWKRAIEQWSHKAMPLQNVKIVVHHDYWPYLVNWLKLDQVVTLEPIPGVAPSASHMARVLDKVAATDIQVIIHASYVNQQASKWLSSKTGIPTVSLPASVDVQQGETLNDWYDGIINTLLDAGL